MLLNISPKNLLKALTAFLSAFGRRINIKKMKILHVEDDEHLARSIKTKILGACPDLEILYAASYAAAVDFLNRHSFDLVVSDFSFPGKNPYSFSGGIDLFRFIVAEFPDLPVHFLSRTYAWIKEILREHDLPLRPIDKIYAKGDQRMLFEAFSLPDKP
jgi:CheY-like chemotaxis protein